MAGNDFRPGSIKSIKLINFMCHESFELSLGPNVNFVIGRNGSGKSALLTAIVVALGGRATTTSRAKRTNEFVMYGKRQAKISLVLHNYSKIMDKAQAFKPDDYGKFITVEKTIHKEDAASRLTLKNDKDKIVSERKQELDEMLEHFGILINNPICVLNQEVSKNFLHSKNPGDKFDLFMKATNLEQIEQDYFSANRAHKDWDECNNRKNVAFRLLDAEYESCKEKTSFLENRARLNINRQALVREKIWAITRDSEVLSEELKSKLDDVNKTIADAQKMIEKRNQKIKNYEEDIEHAKTKIRSVVEKLEETRKRFQEIRSKETHIKTKQIDFKHKIDQCNQKIARINKDNENLESSIVELKRQFNNQNSMAQDNEARKLEIERLESEKSAEVAREKSLRLHTDQLNISMSSTRTELHSANMRVGALKSKQIQNSAILRRLKNGQENTLRKYGDYVIRIRDEIEKLDRQNKFKKRPIGPLGFYLKLKSPDVAAALEAHLGKNAHAFVCDNREDMSLLTSVCKKLAIGSVDFRQPLIITRAFGKRHDVMKFKACHDVYKTMLDYLDIGEDAVFNALVDRTCLESVLFISEYSEAEALMINPNLIPRYTRSAYTKDCSVMHPKTATTGYKSFSNNPSKYMLFSEGNIPQIRELEKENDIISTEIRDAEGVAKGYQDSLNAQRQEYDQNNKEISRIRTDIRKKEEQLLNLKSIVNIEPQEVSALEKELSTNLMLIEKEKVELEKFNEFLVNLLIDLSDIIRIKEDCQSTLKEQDAERQAQAKIIEDTKNNIIEAQAIIKQNRITMEHRAKDRADLTQLLDTTLDKITRSKMSIPQDCQRPNVIRRTADIEEELRKIDAQIRIEQEEMRDPDELMESLKKRMKEIEGLVNLKNSNLSNYSLSVKSLKQRKEGFNNLRSNIVHSLSHSFATVMRSMRMQGVLRINLDDVVVRGEIVKKAKTLEMSIDTSYTPSQRVNLLQSDNNNNSGASQNDSININNRRRSLSQPANAPGQPRAKRARLDPVVESSEKENEVKLTDARSLSGGERSFSTVAFVLSLWRFCSSPFKLMDEIDVFMDMVTRRVSYNYLIRFAQTTDEPGQFIFFSPLELPKFDDSGSFVHVYEMPAIIRKEPPGSVPTV